MKAYPVIRICLLFMSGIILQKIFAADTNILFVLSLLLFLISILVLFTLKASDSILLLASSIVVVLAGAASFSIYTNELKPYPFRVSKLKDVTLYGKINSIELMRDFEFKFLLSTDSLRLNNKTYPEHLSIMCRIRDENKQSLDLQYEKLKPGQYASLKGTISKGRQKRNPGEFDYQNYLEERGISALHTVYSTSDFKILYQAESMPLEEFIFNARKNIDRIFYRYHSKECAALLRGFLLADRSEVDEQVKEDFINTGVVHILAVSGSNVVLIILIITLVFGRFNVVVRSALTLLGLLLFLMITSSSASVLRAVIMGSAVTIVFLINRSHNVFNLLAIAALIILSVSPSQLFDSGFQLSFSAVLSIVVIYPHLKSLIDKLDIQSKIIYKTLLFTAVTIAAEIGVLPFTLYYFGKVSVVSLPANLFVIPLAAVISSVGITTLVLSYISPWLAAVYGAANNFFTDVVLFITHLLGNLRMSYLSISQFSLADLIISYTFLCSYLLIIRKLDCLKAKTIAAIFTLLNIILFCSLDSRTLLPENKLSIMAVDVGQGDATLVKFPNGASALIDAGGVTDYFDNGKNTILPLLNYLGIDKIDYGIISHVDSDHYAGFISLINKGIIRKIFKPELDRSYPKDLGLEQFLKSKGIPILYFRKGSLRLGNAVVYILNTPQDESFRSLNDKSGIVKVVYGNTSFLFEGDAGKAKEDLMAKEYGAFLKADLLKLAHHGSKYSSSLGLLNCVRPRWGLISAGVQNRFGHPSREVLERAANFNIRLLRTDLEGAIILESDGENIRRIKWKD